MSNKIKIRLKRKRYPNLSYRLKNRKPDEDKKPLEKKIFSEKPITEKRIEYKPVSQKKPYDKTRIEEEKPVQKEYIEKPFQREFHTPQEKDVEKKEIKEGIEIPEIEFKDKIKLEEAEHIDVKQIHLKYPLIPNRPKKGEKIFAWAEIRWISEENDLVYELHEPEITKSEQDLLYKIKDFIEQKINVDFTSIRKNDAYEYISDLFEEGLEYFRYYPDKDKKEVIKYYLFRDYIGLGTIEPLLNDTNLEDLSCDGVGIPIYVYHRDPRIGSVKTNIKFETKDELDSFVMKLSEKCGKNLSVAKPLIDASLPDGSRVQATLGTDVATRGSNFTIRKFTKEPLTPTHMLKYGTVDLSMLSYLWLLIEHTNSVLISGGTATGKTSLLNVLSLFIKPSEKIVSIEDTPELRLNHPHWISEVARTSIAKTEDEIDMFKLLKESLRQRPDYIIVGEVRGVETYVLFQQMATGHPGLSTIHAENFPKLLDRLTTKPIELPMSLIQNLDSIIFLRRIKHEKKYIRRVDTVVEVTGFDREKGVPIVSDVFNWNPRNDEFDIVNKSELLKKVAERTNMSEEEVRKELKNRAKVLQWMVKKDITDYKKVVEIINMYYSYGNALVDKISS